MQDVYAGRDSDMRKHVYIDLSGSAYLDLRVHCERNRRVSIKVFTTNFHDLVVKRRKFPASRFEERYTGWRRGRRVKDNAPKAVIYADMPTGGS